MDHTGSEEGKQPAKENGTPSRLSASGDRTTSAHSEQDVGSESARRAFDLLERFSGELEEILLSLERTRSSAASTENSPQTPERTFHPSSVHFDPSPISARIDPYALPPVKSPGVAPRSTLRLVSEAVFLILVAAISARTGLRPLLITVAEAAAFLIVASVELALAHDRRRYRQLPASAPAFSSPSAQETETTSEPISVTLDQVEPLVWQADRWGAEANWPLAVIEPPRKPDEAEKEAQEGITEISPALHAEGEVAAAPAPMPEVRSEAVSVTAADIPAVEPEVDVEPEHRGHFHLFGRTKKTPGTETEAEPEAEIESKAETESVTEIFTSEAEPEHRRGFGLFHREASEPVSEAEAEPEPEAETESVPELPAAEPEHHRGFGLFHREASEPVSEAEAEPEPEAETESVPELPAAEPEHHRGFGLFHHEASEPVSEAGPEVEIEPDAEAEIEPEPEAEIESVPELLDVESEPEHHRGFGLFRHEASEPVSEVGPEVEIEPGAEIEPESEAEIESVPELLATVPEPEPHGHFHLFGREEKTPDAEAEPEAEIEPEDEPEPEAELEIKPKHSDRKHRFRRTAAEAPNGEDEPLEDAFWQHQIEDLGSSAGATDRTIEIDLPPEIPIGEIERTLEELGGREPGIRRRRRLRGANAGKDATEQSAYYETLSGESELRLTAELERRLREREYLRNLRASR